MQVSSVAVFFFFLFLVLSLRINCFIRKDINSGLHIIIKSKVCQNRKWDLSIIFYYSH